MKEYFQRIIDYENKENIYHPDKIDESNDIKFIKMAYRAMYDLKEFDRKNLAKNYLKELNKIKNGEEN